MDQHIPKTAGKPPVVDQPEPGYWTKRLAKGCWTETPVAIYFDGRIWSAEVDGEPQGLPDEDPVHADGVTEIWNNKKTAISAEEYRWRLTTLKEWCLNHYPDHPLMTPRKAYKVSDLRPIPAFTPPKAAQPAVAQPVLENRPAKPKPLDASQIIEWLNYDLDSLVKSIQADVAQLADDALDADGKPLVINDQATLARVAANMDIAGAHLRQAETTRKEAKQPFLAGGTTVDTWFKRARGALETAMQPIQAALNAYAAREDARARKEAAEQAALARAEADRVAQAAAEALAREEASRRQMQQMFGMDVTTAPSALTTALLEEAGEADKQAASIEALAVGSSANLTRTHHQYGGVLSGQEVWGFEIENISKVPLQYLQINESLVGQTIRNYARDHAENARAGVSPIPGVRITRSVSLRNR
jgi:hypothetical protein